MASDLSLHRLQEALIWLEQHCDPRVISPSGYPDFSAERIKPLLDDWSFSHRGLTKEHLACAAAMCRANKFHDAADYFTEALEKLNRRWAAVSFPNGCDASDANPSLLLVAITDVGRYAGALLDSLSRYATTALEANNVLERINAAETAFSNQAENVNAPDTTTPEEELSPDFIRLSDVARLLGHTSKKRLENVASEWRKEGHTIVDPISYAVIRPLVLSQWPNKVRMFPPTIEEVKQILKNLG